MWREVKMKLLLILTLLINTAFAQNSVQLKTGETAPFDGHLVKSERLVKLVKAEKKVLVLSDLRIHQEELTVFHKHDARVQRRKLSEAKFKAFMSNTGYFVLGAVLTALTFKFNQKVGDL
jgi:hypothetical protein